MKILALDPAQKCGWAHSDGQHGVFNLAVGGDRDPLGSQHCRLLEFIESCIQDFGCDMIASENAGFGSVNPATQAMHNERLGVIRLVASRYSLKIKTFQPTIIKLFATGDGHARKPQMIAALNRLMGIRVDSDDEADAIWILELAKRPDCWPVAKPKIRSRSKKFRKLF